ncbi:MAG: hypothetical protein WD512_14940 [Candidatus Paceibacterota bacterium]
MEPTKYYKLNWILHDPDRSDGGKYSDSTNGFFFTSSTHSILTEMNNICQYLDKFLDHIFFYKKNNQYLYQFYQAVNTAVFTKIEITKEEYDSCLRIFGGEVYLVSGSVDTGGPRISISTLDNFRVSFINNFNLFQEEYPSILPFSNLLCINF